MLFKRGSVSYAKWGRGMHTYFLLYPLFYFSFALSPHKEFLCIAIFYPFHPYFKNFLSLFLDIHPTRLSPLHVFLSSLLSLSLSLYIYIYIYILTLFLPTLLIANVNRSNERKGKKQIISRGYYHWWRLQWWSSTAYKYICSCWFSTVGPWTLLSLWTQIKQSSCILIKTVTSPH